MTLKMARKMAGTTTWASHSREQVDAALACVVAELDRLEQRHAAAEARANDNADEGGHAMALKEARTLLLGDYLTFSRAHARLKAEELYEAHRRIIEEDTRLQAALATAEADGKAASHFCYLEGWNDVAHDRGANFNRAWAAWLGSEAKQGLEYTPDGPRIRQITCDVVDSREKQGL